VFLIFITLESKREDKRRWTEWQQSVLRLQTAFNLVVRVISVVLIYCAHKCTE